MILHIKNLKKEGVLVEGTDVNGTVQTDENKVKFRVCFIKADRFVEFKYTTTDYYGAVNKYHYQVMFTSYQSNLGKGEILYFDCPICYRPCRSIFMVNGSAIFKCRKCYSTLPYPTQTSSKMWRSNSQFFNVQNTLERISEMRYAGTYKGKKTKRAKRIKHLENKLHQYDFQRFSPGAFPIKLRRVIFRK